MNVQKDTQGIIWDLDNTLYQFTSEFITAVNIAAAKAAQDLGIKLSYDDTLKLAERSEIDHGYSMHGYVTDHGLSYASLHFPFHDNIDENVVKPIDGMRAALEGLTCPQVILTNASRGWAERVLKYCGLDHLFAADHIVPMEDVGFQAKSLTDAGFKKAAQILDVPYDKIIMADDLDRNLMFPHKLGMRTAYMHQGAKMTHLPDYIDGQFENPIKLIENLFK